jgi:predicted metalloendopeptidase
VFALELKIADSHMTKTEKRDPEATYNKMTLDALIELAGEGSFDFKAWFDGIGKPAAELGEVNVCNVEAVKAAALEIPAVDADTLEHYLRKPPCVIRRCLWCIHKTLRRLIGLL